MTENRGQRTEDFNSDSLFSVLRRLSSVLRAAEIDNPELDARILIAHALGLDRAQLLAQAERVLNDKEIRQIESLIARRVRHEPVSRIASEKEFWSLPFGLNEATLVPRPESELIVETALKAVHPGASRDPDATSTSTGRKDAWTPAYAGVGSSLRILDLGTGSGCLLLALLHELPNATGIGVDCAGRAIEQAKQNAERLDLAKRAEFRLNNWADDIDERFDIVVSNPPYIIRSDITALMPDVRDYDPPAALDGGEDGYDAYRLLIPQLPRLLKPNGIAVFEIGEGQGAAVREIFQKTGFAKIETRRDLAGIERCIMASA